MWSFKNDFILKLFTILVLCDQIAPHVVFRCVPKNGGVIGYNTSQVKHELQVKAASNKPQRNKCRYVSITISHTTGNHHFTH